MTIFTEITLRRSPQATMYADATGPFFGAAMQPYTMLGAQPPQSNSLADDLLVRLAGRHGAGTQEGSEFWGITSADVEAAGADMFAAKGDRVAFVGNDSATPDDKTALEAITYLKPGDVAALKDPANTATAAQFIGARARVQPAEQNAPAVIAATGKYPEEQPTAEDFVNIYGAEEGPKRFDQFRTTAGVAKSFFDMYRAPNQAIHAELRDFEPGPNGSPEERERYEVRAGAAQLILGARDTDPVAYISQIFPGEAPDWSKVSTPQDFQSAITWTRAAQQQMGFDRRLPLPWAVADQQAAKYIDPSLPFNTRFAELSSIVLAVRDPKAREAMAKQISLAAEARWRAMAAQDPSMTPEVLEVQLAALKNGLKWIGENPAQAQYSTMSSLQQFGTAFGDIGRTIAKGATAGGADAIVAKLAPSELDENDGDRLAREQAETEDAEARAGSAGWVAEALGAGLSGYGIASGLYGILGRAGIGVAAEGGGLTGLGVRTGIGAATGGAYGGAYAYNVGESVPQGVLNGALWGAGGNVLAEGLAAIGKKVLSGLASRVAVAKPTTVPDSEPTSVPPVEANEVSGSLNPASEIRRPYAHLEDPPNVAPGQDFTRAQKLKMAEENRKWNGGVLRDDEEGEELIRSKKSEKGVTPPPNEAQFDHIDPLKPADPTKPPGTNSYSNASLASRRRNRKKYNK